MGCSDYCITNLNRNRVHLFLDKVRLRDRHLINKGRWAQLCIENRHTIRRQMLSPTLERAGQEHIYKSVFFLWYNLKTLVIMNELKRRQLRESVANARGENSVWKKQNGGLFKCQSKHIFLKCNSLPTRFWVETAGRIRGQERKNRKKQHLTDTVSLLGDSFRAVSRLKRKIGVHFIKLPILNNVHNIGKDLAYLKIIVQK